MNFIDQLLGLALAAFGAFLQLFIYIADFFLVIARAILAALHLQ